MVQITPRQIDLATTATVRALSSLTQRDAAAVRATVRASGHRYRVEEHDDYDGYLSLMLTPLDGGPGFLVCGRVGEVELAELRGDEMTALGRYPSIGAAMLTLRGALEQGGGVGREDAELLLDRHGSDAVLHAAMRADAEEGGRWRAVIRAIDLRDDAV